MTAIHGRTTAGGARRGLFAAAPVAGTAVFGPVGNAAVALALFVGMVVAIQAWRARQVRRGTPPAERTDRTDDPSATRR